MAKSEDSRYFIGSEDIPIRVPHRDGTLTFISPAVGPCGYNVAGEKLRERNVQTPTGEQTLDLVHAVYCGPERFRESSVVTDVRGKVRNSWLWVPEVAFWVGENDVSGKGVYFIHDPEMKGRDLDVSQEELEERLRGAEVFRKVRISHDGLVRFAPRETYTFCWQKGKVQDNGMIIATYLPKGAENIAKTSRKIDKPVYTGGLDPNPGQMEKRVSALDGNGGRLYVDGNDGGNVVYGFVFGVRA